MLQSKDPERLCNKEVPRRDKWIFPIRRNRRDLLGSGKDGNTRVKFGGRWKGRLLKEMTENRDSFPGQVETWCKSNSQVSTRMTTTKTPNNGRL